MRWLDINLPEPGNRQNLDTALGEVRDAVALIPAIQEREGLDGLAVTRHVAETGRQLFQALVDHDPDTFNLDRRPPLDVPDLDDNLPPDTVGFHFIVHDSWADLPWNWLHNGLEHLLVKHPVSWSYSGAAMPATDQRPWMERQIRAHFAVGSGGRTDLATIVRAVRSGGVGRPQLLFVAGHSEAAMRRLIYREAESIAAALAGSPLGSTLARFEVPAGALTPTRLLEQALAYQAIHYAGPTSRPAALADAADDQWLERLIGDALAPADEDFDSALGLEELPVGVDQITALLDTVSERADRSGSHGGDVLRDRARTVTDAGAGQWLLDDGPLPPEGFGRGAGLPPLVFSNHYRALPELGRRFLRAGASTVIGPQIPVYSRPARRFAGHVYRALAAGSGVGVAAWRASMNMHREVGADHPAWLSYGVQGHGCLALPFL